VINDEAERGFARAATDDERARPSYPAALVDAFVADLGVGPGATVLDLAAGTGKLTRLLVATGADLVAVEPIAEMRDQFAAVLPDVDIVEGTAESLPLDDASVDVVTVAQAFHWFDPGPALDELARVLRPGGRLVLIWNLRDEAVDWVDRFSAIIGGGVELPYRRDYTFQWWADTVARSGHFDPLAERTFDNPQPTTLDLVVDRAASTSYVSALPDDVRESKLAALREMLVGHPDVPVEGEFVFPHHTNLYWCRRAS
jgi:ubiquinone/menaquinone biosynthesis C-methylase UbiE